MTTVMGQLLIWFAFMMVIFAVGLVWALVERRKSRKEDSSEAIRH